MAINFLGLIVFICAIMIIMIALSTWQLRNTNGAKVFSALMFSMSIYILGYSFELSSLNLSMMLFWNKIEYIGILTFPTIYLIFTGYFTGINQWINKRNIVFLFVFPAISLILKLLDNSLHLVYASATIDFSGTLPLLAFTKGPAYYLIVAYNLVMVSLGTFLIIRKRKHSAQIYIKQTNIILAVSLVLYLFYLSYISGVTFFPNLKQLDLNPFVYTLWGLAISYAILRYRLFDLVPIARDTLIETLGDGVLVLDDQCRLVDSNPRAQLIFSWHNQPTGKNIDQLQLNFVNHELLSSLTQDFCFETQLLVQDREFDFEVTLSILKNDRSDHMGYLIVLHDITQRKKIEKELQELSLADELTGLTNRRGFFVLSAQLCSFCARIQKNAILFFVDMDGLKKINDTFGHAAGDQALKDMGQILRSSFRSSDIIARFGGDEFVVMAIEKSGSSKTSMLKRLEVQCELFIKKNQREYTPEFSIGSATFSWKNPKTLEDLLQESDQAMYARKQEKRLLKTTQ